MAKSADEVRSSELLMGLLALAVAEREERDADPKDRRKTEIILDSAGVSLATIARLTGKKPDAIRKSIQRAR